MKETVVVAMSGGVDSSVVAYLLKQYTQYHLIGLFMKNWDEEDGDGTCTATKDYQDVEDVCALLNIPCYTVSFVKEYQDKVFTKFLHEYRSGLTPNPDVLCNREIKFNILRQKAIELGAQFLATGHYCRLKRVNNMMTLAKGKDSSKDQSYFLSDTPLEYLQNVLFPIGDMYKYEVRAIAERIGLSNAKKKDSTGICFIGKKDFKEFLKGYLSEMPGDIIDYDTQKVIKQHDGIHYYTIGQRRGLDIGGSALPYYVIGKDLERHVIYVVQGEDNPLLYKKALIAKNLNWFIRPPAYPYTCTAKVRYRSHSESCVIQYENKNREALISFPYPVKAVTPGQSIVFYQNDLCLGGGVIEVPMNPDSPLRHLE